MTELPIIARKLFSREGFFRGLHNSQINFLRLITSKLELRLKLQIQIHLLDTTMRRNQVRRLRILLLIYLHQFDFMEIGEVDTREGEKNRQL